MQIKNISVIVGTRPQIIKSQPVVNALLEKGFEVELIHTGQHYDYNLSQNFFTELRLAKPSVNLGIGKGTPIQQIARMITKLESYFKKRIPDLAIIPGDTTSALAAALTASKMKIKFAHLESGARSNQFYMTEEINRRIIDHSANVLFAPTRRCVTNLKKESVFGKVFFVGDTMYDLFISQFYSNKLSLLYSKRNNKQILLTIHRAENVDNKTNLSKICHFINKLVKREYHVIFPIHPHTRLRMKEFNLEINAELIDPINYIETLKRLASSSLAITDSGGLQKEAYWLRTPCITLRDNTEWYETVQEKANFLFSLSKPIPIEKIERIVSKKITPKHEIFGNGKASEKIVDIISKLNF